ncbi:hypothetical protein HY493_00360 [Candidatus Woesearchaeota archaeon]|nr:hypothetical protein [Candidatus Woesearchaeota archaeon]
MRHHPALRDVHPDHAFAVKDGPKLRNLYDLERELRRLSDGQFKHHVNDAKNDFYNWIYHIVKDEELAMQLAQVQDKKAMANVVERRIKQLEHGTTEKRKAAHKRTITNLKEIAKLPQSKEPVPAVAPLPPLPSDDEIRQRIRGTKPLFEQAVPNDDEFEALLHRKVVEPVAMPEPTTPDPTEPESAPEVTVPETVQKDIQRHMLPYILGLMAGVLMGLVIAKFFI